MKFSETGRDVGNVTVGVNEFVRRQTKESPYAYFEGLFEHVAEIARWNIADAEIVQGTLDNPRVLLVKVDPKWFYSAVVCVDESNVVDMKVSFESRRPEEEKYLKVSALGGTKKEATVAELVLYSREALAEGNENSTKCDYEIVSINAGLVANEPMHPLTMARNYLVKTGGTKAEYTAEQFAQAIWYWKDKVAG